MRDKNMREGKIAYANFQLAHVQSFNNPFVGMGPKAFCGGPVLEGDSFKNLRHTRSRVPVDSFRADETYSRRLSGEYIYAGPMYGHFGHFISEMAHRIIPAKVNEIDAPFLFLTTTERSPYPTYLHFPRFAQDILTFLKVKQKDVRIISESSIVENLHIYQQGSDLGGGALPEYLEMLTLFSKDRLNEIYPNTFRPDMLYVSRSGLSPAGMILGERYFEQQLEHEGFTIIRPEELSFSAQMDYYCKADIAIFSEGSACHGTELLGTGMMKNTYLLPRRNTPVIKAFKSILECRSEKTECLIDCMNYLGSAYVRNEDNMPLSFKGASILNIDKFVDFFRKAGLAKFSGFSVREYLNSSLADLQSYAALAKADPLYRKDILEDVYKNFDAHAKSYLRDFSN